MWLLQQTHTAQHWADTFITELNDTHIEADLRMRHTPPPVSYTDVVAAYQDSRKRLIVLGYNATLTTNIEAPRLPKRQFEQVWLWLNSLCVNSSTRTVLGTSCNGKLFVYEYDS